jgi:Spy/CpxP family protein refolding chaperone
MKRGAIILVLAVLAGICAFCLMRWHKLSVPPTSSLLEAMPELAWMREELDLTDDQFAKVSELHAEYRPTCVEMCERIAQAHERLEAAAHSSDQISDELRAAIADHAQIHADCQEAMVGHLYRTAATLNKEQAQHYLETMLPYALDFSHSEPEGIHGR